MKILQFLLCTACILSACKDTDLESTVTQDSKGDVSASYDRFTKEVTRLRVTISMDNKEDVVLSSVIDNSQKEIIDSDWERIPYVNEDMQSKALNSCYKVLASLDRTSSIGRSFLPFNAEEIASVGSADEIFTIEDAIAMDNIKAEALDVSLLEKGYAVHRSKLYGGLTVWWLSYSDRQSDETIWSIEGETMDITKVVSSLSYTSPRADKPTNLLLNIACLTEDKITELGGSRVQVNSGDFEALIKLDDTLSPTYHEVTSISYPKEEALSIPWFEGWTVYAGFPVFSQNNEPMHLKEKFISDAGIDFPDEVVYEKSLNLKKEVIYGDGYGVVMSKTVQSLFGYFIVDKLEGDVTIKVEAAIGDEPVKEIEGHAWHMPSYSNPFVSERNDTGIVVFAVPGSGFFE